MKQKKTYFWLTDLLSISRNNSNNLEGKIIIFFRIEMNISNFTAKLHKKKLEKAINATANI